MVNDLAERLRSAMCPGSERCNVLTCYPDCECGIMEAAAARIEAMEEALKIAEQADQQHINCPECEGEGQAEECGTCYPLADEARLARWAALGINQKESAKVLPLRRAARVYANKGEPT